METAVAYIRVSSQRQVDEGNSLDVQTKQVQAFADQRGYKLARVFREAGESAKTDQRPELQRMLQYCRDPQSHVRVVIVPKIDRLARNVGDYTNLKLLMSRLGIRLESLGERIEDTPVGRFTETILASVAQFDNEVRAERCKGGMVESVSQGRWVWKAPIGYRNVRHLGKGNIEPDQTVAPLVQRAFALLASGQHDAREVHGYLLGAGVAITESGFYKLIRNKVYIGRIHAFGGVYNSQPPFTPLVDLVTFNQAQANIKNRNWPSTYKVETEDFPLRGSIVCVCSRRFTASWSRGKYGKRYAYYRCPHCNGPSYPSDKVEVHFVSFLRTYKGREDAWQRLEAALRALDEELRTQGVALRAQAAARLSELQRLQDAVALKNASGVIPDDLARRQIKQLSEQMNQAASDFQSDDTDSVENLLTFARSFFTDLATTWPLLSLRRKKDLLRFMFPEGVLFHPESGFRTLGNPLSEQLQRVVSGADSTLVDPEVKIWKSLRGLFTDLRTIACPPRDEFPVSIDQVSYLPDSLPNGCEPAHVPVDYATREGMPGTEGWLE